ncbi:MAG TPA: hypothetical protein VGG36_10955 [Rhizomicrobium sp.]
MADKTNLPSNRSPSAQIDAFLARAAKTPALTQVKGRLIFAIDATMSRQPTWDRAVEIQADMFDVAQTIGGLGVQLVYFRGRSEFEVSEWTTTPSALAGRMRDVRTRSGFTQLTRVLKHACDEAKRTRVGTLVYVGDALEENPEAVAKQAAELALLGVPCFMFHEGDDPNAAASFKEVARLTKGVYARFDAGAAKQLRDLLRAAAVYATGGKTALRDYGDRHGGEVLRLARAMDGK